MYPVSRVNAGNSTSKDDLRDDLEDRDLNLNLGPLGDLHPEIQAFAVKLLPTLKTGGLALAGLGHKVTLLTLPYSEWHKKMDALTQKQRVLHTRDALAALKPLVEHVSLLDFNPGAALPAALMPDIEQISLWDAQYTLMREEVDLHSSPPSRALIAAARRAGSVDMSTPMAAAFRSTGST